MKVIFLMCLQTFSAKEVDRLFALKSKLFELIGESNFHLKFQSFALRVWLPLGYTICDLFHEAEC